MGAGVTKPREINMEIRFLTAEEVEQIHKRVVAEFGGSAGIRDRGLLESAIAQPQMTFGGEYLHPSVPEMAAAYLYHLCGNHPFIDGNKRVGLAAALVFLELNGLRLKAEHDIIEKLVWEIAAGNVSKGHLSEFCITHCVPIAVP